MIDVLLILLSFVVGATLTWWVIALTLFFRTTIPTKQRNDYLIAWLRRPLRSPEIPDLYSQEWSCWIRQLVRDWKDQDRAVMAVRAYLGSQADDAVEHLERNLSMPSGISDRSAIGSDCDLDQHVEREVERVGVKRLH